jgi:hypothetical protein
VAKPWDGKGQVDVGPGQQKQWNDRVQKTKMMNKICIRCGKTVQLHIHTPFLFWLWQLRSG